MSGPEVGLVKALFVVLLVWPIVASATLAMGHSPPMAVSVI